jgi:5-methylcytosine-specific restriction protein A
MSDTGKCEFCGMVTTVRFHHLIPRCKGGKETTPACPTCEGFIHSKWSHNELRDTYNTVDAILADEGFQKFLKWRRKQPATTLFKSDTGKSRDKRKYS